MWHSLPELQFYPKAPNPAARLRPGPAAPGLCRHGNGALRRAGGPRASAAMAHGSPVVRARGGGRGRLRAGERDEAGQGPGQWLLPAGGEERLPPGPVLLSLFFANLDFTVVL